MIFLLHDAAGEAQIRLDGEPFRYLIRVRRQGVGDVVALRHQDRADILYRYHIAALDGRRATLTCDGSERVEVTAPRALHLAWCLIDPKVVEKTLPMLSEIGVNAITFLQCARSQKNFRLDFERMVRILHSSMQQSGRSTAMTLAMGGTPQDFIAKHPRTAIFDFGGDPLRADMEIETIMIGCEGGFTEAERAALAPCRTFRLETPMVLRSETAAVAAAAKLLL